MLKSLIVLLFLNGLGLAWGQTTPRVVAVAAGSSHSLFTNDVGTLFAMGLNNAGQLGDGTTINRTLPVLVASGVGAMAAGAGHSLFLKTDGTLWAMGSNGSGQLGDDTTISRTLPVLVTSGVSAMAAGSAHSLFLKTDGTLFAMGLNSSGQLGDGTTINRTLPVQVATGVRAMAAGDNHSLFIKTDGTLWAMGQNTRRQLGDGTGINRTLPVPVANGVAAVAAGEAHSLFLTDEGILWSMGRVVTTNQTPYSMQPIQIQSGVSAVSTGGNHILFLKPDGTLWGMGHTTWGQLRDRTPADPRNQTVIESQVLLLASNVSTMAGGGRHTLYVTTTGDLWTRGDNRFGQLGDVPTFVDSGNRTLGSGLLDLALRITAQPANQTAVVGTTVTFTVSARGVPGPSLQWRKNGVEIAGAREASLTLSDVQGGDAGIYSVQVVNSEGSVTSAGATLTVVAGSIIPRQTAIKDKTVVIYADSSGVGTIRWQVSSDRGSSWTDLLDGPNYAGTSTALLSMPAVASALDGTWFRYQVSYRGSTYSSAPAELQVITSPLVMPAGLTAAGADLYVTDAATQTVMKITPDLRLTTVAGSRGSMGGADGLGPAARFNEPTGIFYRSDLDSFVVADTANSTIRSVALSGQVTTLAGQAGVNAAADGLGSAARFHAPTGVDTDTFGVYVVVDQANHTIRLVTTGGNVATLAGKAGIPGAVNSIGDNARFSSPTDIMQGRSRGPLRNLLVVSDTGNHTIRTISADARVETYAGQAGQAGTTDGGRFEVRFNRPTGVAIDGDGDLFVADTGNHTIRKHTWGNARWVTWAGIPGVSGLMDGPGVSALFNAPEGLAFDDEGNLLVADTGNAAIRKISPAGVVATLAIQGDVPVITAQPAGSSVTAGSSATFTVTATGDSPLTYQWRKDGTAIAGATASTYTLASVAAADAGGYSVVVSNPAGSVTSNTATLTVAASTPPPSGGGGGGGGSSGGGGGGGGAPSLWMLAAVCTLLVWSRTRLATTVTPAEPPAA